MRKIVSLLLILTVSLMGACSYTSEKAVKNGDVINMHGPVYNVPRFELFLENIETQTPDTVRIANYTLEGDPTLYNLTFNGSSIDFEIDRSKNKNRGDNPTKVAMTCTDLVTEDGQQVFTYTLKGCNQDSFVESFKLLTVLKEQEEEDEHEH